MTAKKSTQYRCSNCANVTFKWSGKCEQCSAWNTLEEENVSTKAGSGGKKLKPTKLANFKSHSHARIHSGIKELDGLLGGGLVRDGVCLIAGEPGIGKSTLLMQIAGGIASEKDTSVLYVSAEESFSQIAARAKRLNVKDSATLEIIEGTSVEDIVTTIDSGSYSLVIVDSIQTISSSDSNSAAGTVSQVTLAGQKLTRVAKSRGSALVLVGHVTKEGNIAGPKVLEHLVDVVLGLEGDRYGALRVLRSRKNRYGPTDELLLMDMTSRGLIVMPNASEVLLKERQISDGSVVLASLDGNQPLLVEVQALVSPTSFGYPKRTAVGFELNRLNLLIAMLDRRTKLKLSSHDIYLNIVGGFKVNDPGADLAVCMAIASAAKGMELSTDAAIFGEVGLSGEVRHVPGAQQRIKEAKALGFKKIIGPGSVKTTNKAYEGAYNVKDALNRNLKGRK